MAMTTRVLLALGGLALVAPAPGRAQGMIRGIVLAGDGDQPLGGSYVATRRGKLTTATDRQGRFAIWIPAFPDTIVLAAIGRRPDSVIVTLPLGEPLVVRLSRAPAALSDLIVVAPRGTTLDLSNQTRWQMPIEVARSIPPAVETDVFRSLAMIPAVSFSSPLSARPMLRGYDAQEVSTRVDGFEMLNLYHLGRIFASFPADATQDLAVAAAPYTAATGGSAVGLIDLTGRTGWSRATHGGGGLSFGSLGAYLGGGSDRARFFGAARTFHYKALALAGIDVPYHFEDLYASAVFGDHARPHTRVTLFATADGAGSAGIDARMRWYNLLLGVRRRVYDRGPTSVELSAGMTSYVQDGTDVPGLHSAAADFRNRFHRASITGDLTHTTSYTRVGAGFSAGWRRIENRIALTASLVGGPDRSPQAATDLDRVELGVYVEGSRVIGPVTAQAGVRVEAAGTALAIQPRAHLRLPLTNRLELTAAVGRASRLFHLLGDARSEPDLDFLDFWLNAGSDSVPVLSIDHATVDLSLDVSPLVARVSGFASRGRGIGELRPETDQRPPTASLFRFGDSRTRGLEAQLAYRGGASGQSFSISYVLSRSDRRWDGVSWIRWAEDRTHQLRLYGQTKVGSWTFFTALDAGTGIPLTPVFSDGIVRALPGKGYGNFTEIYGRENSAKTSGTFRIDAGAAHSFTGPGKSRLTLGIAVINLSQTQVAPIVSNNFDGQATADGRYGRLFRLPGVPTFTLRAEF